MGVSWPSLLIESTDYDFTRAMFATSLNGSIHCTKNSIFNFFMIYVHYVQCT